MRVTSIFIRWRQASSIQCRHRLYYRRFGRRVIIAGAKLCLLHKIVSVLIAKLPQT